MTRDILIAEDSPTQSLLLRSVLEGAGFRVHAATDGRAALDHLRAHLPHLLISDVTMPGMDGYELCRAIRADQRLEGLPVLLLTGLADEEKVLTGLEAGADAFISKPFDNARLLERVGDLLGDGGSASRVGDDDCEVLFAQKKYRIIADRRRILRYLISTYDNALQINARLGSSEEELRSLNSLLEEKVRNRTEALSQEVQQRRRAQQSLQAANRLLEIANRHRDREALLSEFQAEIRSFSGCADAAILLAESGRGDAMAARIGGLPGPRIPIRLVNEVLGHVAFPPGNGGLSLDAARVIETASTQLAAALRRIDSERTIRESEEKYRQFFEDDLAGAVITSMDGRILSCNPAFAGIFGFGSAAQAVGSSIVALYGGPEWASLLSSIRNGGRTAGREAECRRRDGGNVFVIQSAVGKVDERGNLEEIRHYLVDITEKKGLEQRLFQARKMEAIGRLAGGVAHDFNNILQVIQGFADHLLKKTPEEDERHGWLRQIQLATEKASTLIQSLLAFSRRQEQHKVVLDLNTVLAEIEPMLRQLCGEPVDLNLAPAPNLGKIEADRMQLDQLIMNLAANARDAMPGGGTLTVETSDVLIAPRAREFAPDEPKAGAWVLLAVRDTGQGMDKETMEHMFEPFFTTKPRGKGTGLGLATVYGVVHQAEGYIQCASTPGRGTEFRIFLPRIAGVSGQ